MENLEITATQASQDLGSHSLAQIMAILGIKSKSSVTAYKNMVKTAFAQDLSRVLNADQTVTDEGLQQIKLAGQFAKRKNKTGYYQAVWQAHPELQYDLPDQSVTKKQTKPDQPGPDGRPSWSRNFDPFAGVNQRTSIVRREITAMDLSENSAAKARQTDEAILNGQQFTHQFVIQMGSTAQSVGTEIGELLAQQTINQIENTRQARLADYLQSQGVSVVPKGGGERSPQSA